jgi:large subunit ribosomal protein L28
LWSDSLKVFVRTRVTTRVLRTIDKVGGLDAYLLGIKPARVKELGPWGWRLRWRVMQTPAVREQFAREREALGLEPVMDGAAVEVDGMSEETLMAETDKMLAREEEIALGEEAQEVTFMREEKVKLKDLKK